MATLDNWRDRFWEKIIVRGPSECWEWNAAHHQLGYGRFYVNRTRESAHRILYQLFIGPIPSHNPDGEILELDHLCRNPKCVNPNHLECVTHYENLARSPKIRGNNHTKIRCPQGHLYISPNLAYTPDGKRYCKECKKLRTQAYRAGGLSGNL